MGRIRTWLLGTALLLGPMPWATAQDAGGTKTGEATKVAPSVEAWVKTLATKIADRHDLVRQSARLAILAVGAGRFADLAPGSKRQR